MGSSQNISKIGGVIIKNKYLIILCTVIIVAALSCVGNSYYQDRNQAKNCINKYFKALCTNNVEQAKEQVTGQALWSLTNVTELPEAVIEKTNISVPTSNKDWARANVVIETRLKDGTIDVGWYDINLINTDQGWKIFAINIQVPEPKQSFIANTDAEKPKKVFEQYLKTLSTEYLAGAARIAQEQNKVHLDPIEYKNLEFFMLAANKDYMVLKTSYYTEREVELCVTFYKSIDNWKIVNIQQL